MNKKNVKRWLQEFYVNCLLILYSVIVNIISGVGTVNSTIKQNSWSEIVGNLICFVIETVVTVTLLTYTIEDIKQYRKRNGESNKENIDDVCRHEYKY